MLWGQAQTPRCSYRNRYNPNNDNNNNGFRVVVVSTFFQVFGSAGVLCPTGNAGRQMTV
jgi:hypothetical protein